MREEEGSRTDRCRGGFLLLLSLLGRPAVTPDLWKHSRSICRASWERRRRSQWVLLRSVFLYWSIGSCAACKEHPQRLNISSTGWKRLWDKVQSIMGHLSSPLEPIRFFPQICINSVISEAVQTSTRHISFCPDIHIKVHKSTCGDWNCRETPFSSVCLSLKMHSVFLLKESLNIKPPVWGSWLYSQFIRWFWSQWFGPPCWINTKTEVSCWLVHVVSGVLYVRRRQSGSSWIRSADLWWKQLHWLNLRRAERPGWFVQHVHARMGCGVARKRDVMNTFCLHWLFWSFSLKYQNRQHPSQLQSEDVLLETQRDSVLYSTKRGQFLKCINKPPEPTRTMNADFTDFLSAAPLSLCFVL